MSSATRKGSTACLFKAPGPGVEEIREERECWASVSLWHHRASPPQCDLQEHTAAPEWAAAAGSQDQPHSPSPPLRCHRVPGDSHAHKV